MSIPDSEALDALHHHLKQWRQGAGSLTEEEINSVGEEEPQDPLEQAASIRRGRQAAGVSQQSWPTNRPDLDPDATKVTIGEPVINERVPMPAKGGVKLTDDAPTPGPSNSPRGAMLSAIMGSAKAQPPSPAPAIPDTSKPLGFHDDAMESAVSADKRSGAMGDLGKAVTAFTERPTNELDAIQQLGGVRPSARQHNGIWDKEQGTAVADLTRQRSASASMASAAEKKDPNSTTANTYRSVLLKFAPDLADKLKAATPEQMEKIAPWLEKYAAENADALKAQLAAAHKKEADARHDTEHKEVMDDRRATHADAQANASAMRALAGERMKTEQENKDQAGAQHLGDKAGEGQSAAKALDEIDATIAKSPDDIPGVGKWKSMVPDVLKPTVLSDEGLSVRNNARDVLGILLHKRSGAAVSPAELSRYEQMYGLNGSDSQFKDGMARMRRDYPAELAATQAGVSPAAKQKFKQGGGMLAEDVAPKGVVDIVDKNGQHYHPPEADAEALRAELKADGLL